jgi:enamine deaminase RidA (YjgF/YER057c/UK114 family)
MNADRLPHGIDQRLIVRPGHTELLLTAVGGDPVSARERLEEHLAASGSPRVVKANAFVDEACMAGDAVRAGLLAENADWPVTVVGGEAGPGGIRVRAVAGCKVETLRVDGRTVGTVYEDGHLRRCLLGGIHAGAGAFAKSPREQTVLTFEAMARALELAGMNFAHLVRTWFYLDDILTWYDAFNDARDEFFAAHGVFDRRIPASTGVGGLNPAGAAVVGELMAVQPLDDRVQMQAVASPLQPEATAYGSAFSRAVEITTPDDRQLLISGTASIDADGNTAHPGDAEAQIALTMDVVRAILESREMNWMDVTGATVFFKRQEDAQLFERYCAQHDLAQFPTLMTRCDICRDDLLFEIELDAATTEVLTRPEPSVMP